MTSTLIESKKCYRKHWGCLTEMGGQWEGFIRWQTEAQVEMGQVNETTYGSSVHPLVPSRKQKSLHTSRRKPTGSIFITTALPSWNLGKGNTLLY